MIRSCGLAPAKAKAIHALSAILRDQYGGRVPADIDALEALPGVGHKTASVVMVQAFGVPAFPVDTHIHRLAGRWGLSRAHNVAMVERDLKALFPREDWGKVHLQIILFGREHCPARGHDLRACPICSWAASKARIAREMGPARPRRSLGVRVRVRIHPEHLPVVAVRIVEAPAVHEAVVLRLHRVLAARGDRAAHELVHLRAARARDREQRLGVGAVSQICLLVKSAKRSRPSSITNASSETIMQVAVSSVKFGSNVNPSSVKKSTDRFRLRTGRLTKQLVGPCRVSLSGWALVG